jgi:hypothetical protein
MKAFFLSGCDINLLSDAITSYLECTQYPSLDPCECLNCSNSSFFLTKSAFFSPVDLSLIF